MTLACAAYSALFWAKQTAIVGWLVFKDGQPFTVLDRHRTITGRVTGISWHETDGDRTFNVQVDAGPDAQIAASWHCEITPCTVADLSAFMAQLTVGARVVVTGDHCFDPPHLKSAGGGHEIHPVRAASVVNPC